MKVAIINPYFQGHAYRGVGKYTQRLSSALKKYTDVDVTSVNLNELPVAADLYHFPYFDPFNLTLPFIKRQKTVVTIHDLIPIKFPQHFPRGIKGELKWQIQKRLVKNADAIITDSYVSAGDIQALLGIAYQKIKVVPLAADELFFVKKTRTELDKLRTKYQLPQYFALSVGDVNWNKNIPLVIKACIKTDYPLVIVSQAFAGFDINRYNPWQKDLREATELAALASKVSVISGVSDSELGGAYQLATMLLMPSRYEGFGLPVLEAFASGCPVICSKKGSLEEVADDAALFVSTDENGDLVNAILKLSSDVALRQKLVSEAYIRAKSFSWEKVAKDTVAAYQTLYEK